MANINWPNPTFVGQTYVSDNGDSWRWTGQYWQSIGTSAIGGTGATGQVTIWSGTSSITGSPRITYSDTPGSDVKITISDSGFGSVLGRGFIDTSVNNGGATNVIRSASNTNGVASVIELKKARNTIAVPNTLTSGTYLGEVQYTGAYDGLGGYRTSSTIRSEASELWSSTASGTKLSINTISNTTTTLTERFSIEGNGLVRFYGLYTFPNSNGTVGQVLTTSGAGTLSWSTISAASLGAVGGTGTINYLSKWTTGGTTLVNSQIRDDGTTIGINIAPNSVYRTYIKETTSSRTPLRVENTQTAATANTTVGSFLNDSVNTGGFWNYALSISSTGSTSLNVGIESLATTNTVGGTAISGIFDAVGTSTQKYSLRLKDGTQLAGRFLKSITSEGHANWANITAADVSGILTGSGTDGQMALWNSSGALSGSNYIAYDLTSLNAGITITDPGVTNGYTALKSGDVEVSRDNAVSVRAQTFNSNANTASTFSLRRARGTNASPTSILSGDIIGEYNWIGAYGTLGSQMSRSAYIQSTATENWSSIARGGGIKIATVSNGITIPVVRFEILGTGQIKFNNSYTFPSAAASSANSLLLSDASGILSWGTASALSIPTGTGTADYVTRWTGTNTQGIGIIRDNLTTIGINADPALYTTSRLAINETLNQKVPFKIDYITPTNSGTSVTNVAANITASCNSSGQSGSFTALELRVLNAQGSNVGLNIGIQGTNSLAFQTNVGILNHIGTSFPSMGTSVNNYGIYTNIETQNSSKPVIGGYFTVATNSGTGGRYALQLIDGTQTTLGGKFLKDVGGGKANWASLTAADISGVVTGAGASNKVAFWSNGTNLSYDTGMYYSANTLFPGMTFVTPSGNGRTDISSGTFSMQVNNGNTISTLTTNSDNVLHYPIIQMSRGSLSGAAPSNLDSLGRLQWGSTINAETVLLESSSAGVHSASNWGSSFTISTRSQNGPTAGVTPIRFVINGGYLNPSTSTYGSPQIALINSTVQIGNAAIMSTHASGSTGARKYHLEVDATQATNGMYIRSLNPGIGIGTDNEVVAISAHSINTVGNRIGIYGMSSNSTTSNIGVKGEVLNNGAGYNVGGQFVVPTATTAYAIQLIDGSESTAGKFLRNMDTSGRARWADVSPTDFKNYIVRLNGTMALGTNGTLGLTASTLTGRIPTLSGGQQDSNSRTVIFTQSQFIGFSSNPYNSTTGVVTLPTAGWYEISIQASLSNSTGWPANSSITAMLVDSVSTGSYYMASRGSGTSYNPYTINVNDCQTLPLPAGNSFFLRLLLNGTTNYTVNTGDRLELTVKYLGN